MIAKIHQLKEGKIMIALCDEELINQKIEEGDQQLDLTSEFYKGEKISEEELKPLIKKAKIINAVGKRTIAFLKKQNEIKEKILTIKEIPHAQIITYY